jgi:endonuclease I
MRALRTAVLVVATLAVVSPAPGQVINEFVASHSGTDIHEYVEILGAPSTDYAHLWVVQLDGDQPADGGNPGHVDSAFPAGTTDAHGLWVSALLDHVLSNDSISLFLVDSFSGTVGDDLDIDDDGVLDTTPWVSQLDTVAVSDGDSGDVTYGPVSLGRGMDENWSFPPGGASRLPDGEDDDLVTDWVRNDFYLYGMPGEPGDWMPGEAYNTPGQGNAPALRPLVISEFVANHAGTDDHEFIETLGEPGRNYSRIVVLVVEGDAPSTGTIDAVFPVAVTDSTGMWRTGFLDNQVENGTLTLFTVEGFTGTTGDDIDADDDGLIDPVPPWSSVHDSVAVHDGDAGDLTYSETVLDADFDGGTFTPGGASRVPTGVDSDSVDDWVRNDFDGEGLDLVLGGYGPLAVEPGEAYNTPGTANRCRVDDLYAGVDDSTPQTLRSTLHVAVSDHLRAPYTRPYPWSGTQTWDTLELADEDPVDPNMILDVYHNRSFVKRSGGYNREHTWPKSYGFTDNNTGNMPYTDCIQLFLCDGDYNSSRSNYPFAPCTDPSCLEAPTDFNHGQGGTGQSNWYSSALRRWQTWPGRRGDVARAQLYLDVRYEGGVHAVTGYAEPDLVLTDDPALITTSNDNEPVAYMGMLETLLQWHDEDPVDDIERRRNGQVWAAQGNRNPFIDHPEWVECVFRGTGCGAGLIFADGFESGDTTAW